MQATNSMPVSTLTFLDECHSLVIEHLRPHIKKMFENCDTAFMDFAGKAQSNAIQRSFFEAMAVVRRNRGDLEKIFYRELGRSFADFSSGIDQPKHAGATEADSMTLISKDDMDIQTARQNMVTSATMGSAQVLGAMRQRLATLNHGQKLGEKDIPGGPSSLDSAYHLAASSLVIEHQALLILYMLFNKFVMGTIDQLYYEYNKHLLKAGLLPNLKYEVRINPSKAKAAEGKKAVFPENKSGRANSNRKGNDDNHADVNSKTDSNNTGSGNGNSDQSLGDELFGDIMQLLSRRDIGKQGQQQATISNPIPQTGNRLTGSRKAGNW
jgi:hypothetical protein